MSLLFEKGHVFIGPDGQGYELTRDIRVYDPMMDSDLKAFGGAPETGPNMVLPDWMSKYLAGYKP